jgi:hypothetical protein
VAAVEVADRILEDALKEQRQFRGRPPRIALSQPQHRILNDVQCRLLVADGEQRLLEGAPLYFCEEVREFFIGSQWVAFFLLCGYRFAPGPTFRRVRGILAKHYRPAKVIRVPGEQLPIMLFTGIFA